MLRLLLGTDSFVERIARKGEKWEERIERPERPVCKPATTTPHGARALTMKTIPPGSIRRAALLRL